MPKRDLILHIGTPKTGTTAIQKFLEKNESLLRKKGFSILTPRNKDPLKNTRFLSARLGCWGAKELVLQELLPMDVGSQKKRCDEWYARFKKALLEDDTRTTILSEEILWEVACKKDTFSMFIEEVKECCNVKVIVYFRRQDNFLMSKYQQALKDGWGNGKTCHEWLESPDNLDGSANADYFVNLQWIADLIGKEHITVRVYEKKQFANESIFHDFLKTLTIELTDEFQIPTRDANPGLSAFGTELARCFSRHNGGKFGFAFLAVKHHNITIYKTDIVPHNSLPPTYRRKLLCRFKDGNARIAKEYLGRSDGRLFYDPEPDPATDWSPYQLSMDEATSFLLKVVYKQTVQLESIQKDIWNIQRRLNPADEERRNERRRLKEFCKKLPGPVQYSLRKTWRTLKFLKKLFSKGT